jgi:hypothetical protein
MDPIVETSEGVTGSGERVDLGENESNSDSDSEDSVEPRTTILALVAPSLEHEHTAVVIPVEGRQPEPEETREAFCSQVDVAMEQDVLAVTIPGPSRASVRQMAANNNATRIEDIAIKHVASRNLDGPNLSSHNSFADLDSDDIYLRALEMGINASSLSLEKIDCLKDLEIARHNINMKKDYVVSTVEEQVLPASPLLLGFGEESNDGEDFTHVISKRTKKKMRSAAKLSKRSNHSEGVKSGGGA